MASYVISDIHGHLDLFLDMLKQINFTSTDSLIILGDAIDKGPNSVEVLELIKSTPNMELILGNHEYMLLQALNANINLKQWYNCGGEQTCRELLAKSDEYLNDLCEYLSNCKLDKSVVINNQSYLLSHNLPSTVEIPGNILDKTDFCLNRRLVVRTGLDDSITYIQGHTPVQLLYNVSRIFKMANTFYIDCGYDTQTNMKILSCMRLDDLAEFYSR